MFFEFGITYSWAREQGWRGARSYDTPYELSAVPGWSGEASVTVRWPRRGRRSDSANFENVVFSMFLLCLVTLLQRARRGFRSHTVSEQQLSPTVSGNESFPSSLSTPGELAGSTCVTRGFTGKNVTQTLEKVQFP